MPTHPAVNPSASITAVPTVPSQEDVPQGKGRDGVAAATVGNFATAAARDGECNAVKGMRM